MTSAEIDRRNRQQPLGIRQPLIPHADQMIGIERAQKPRHLRHPGQFNIPRLIAQFPREDRGLIAILPARARIHPQQHMFHVISISRAQTGMGIKLRLLLQPEPAQILTNATEIVPVIHQRQNQPDTALFRHRNGAVQKLQTVLAIVISGLLRRRIQILKVSIVVLRAALQKSPRAQRIQAHSRRRIEHRGDHLIRRMTQIIVVRSGHAKRLAVHRKPASLRAHEAVHGLSPLPPRHQNLPQEVLHAVRECKIGPPIHPPPRLPDISRQHARE